MALQSGQITLQKGEKIEVLRKDDDGWWTGRAAGKEGLFPGNYVEKAPEEAPPPPPPARPSVDSSPAVPSKTGRSAESKLETTRRETESLQQRLANVQAQVDERIQEKQRLTVALQRMKSEKDEIAVVEGNITRLKAALAQVAALVAALPSDGIYA